MRTIFLTLIASFLLPVAQAQKSAATPDEGGGLKISRAGSRPMTPGPAKFFTGSAKVEQLFPADARSRVSGGIVTFAPGARSAWHTHPFGQTLLITAGTGRGDPRE
jgi:hypothetical protein